MLRLSDMYLKVHNAGLGRVIVAVCDTELIGKTFTEGDLQLTVSEKFYKGDDLEEDKVLVIMKTAPNVNIVGKKAIKLALKARIIIEDNILTVEGVPYANASA